MDTSWPTRFVDVWRSASLSHALLPAVGPLAGARGGPVDFVLALVDYVIWLLVYSPYAVWIWATAALAAVGWMFLKNR